MKKITYYFLLFIFLLFVIPQSAFAKKRVYSSFLGVAINGYDAVAYFLESKPVEGNKEFVYEWEGTKWRFASAKNLELFQNNPQKYAPQYGGFCAYAMAKGSFAATRPEAWTIVNEKLYLNYDLDVNKVWRANQGYFISFADIKWKDIWKSGN